MQANSDQPSLTVDYLLDGLTSQRIEIQQQLLQQSRGRAMLPKGLFNGMRRAFDVMIQDLLQDEPNLELAIEVLEKGEPGCIEAAFKILTTPANALGPIDLNLLGAEPRVMH